MPRGPHGLPRERVASSQRERLAAAVTQAVAERGYVATTVADITAHAGVSRKTFYELFRDKEQCFLAACDAASDTLLASVGLAVASPLGPGATAVDRLRACVDAYLHHIAGDPPFARTFFLEIAAAGKRARDHKLTCQHAFADLLLSWHQHATATDAVAPHVPDEAYAAAVTATEELVCKHIRAGRTRDLPDLAPLVMYVQLALLAMPDAASAQLSG